jgi:hypothetical protein
LNLRSKFFSNAAVVAEVEDTEEGEAEEEEEEEGLGGDKYT